MARKTKAPTRRPATKKKSATAKPKPAQKRKAAARKGAAARSTEVERTWAAYLKQRTALEHAVAAVQAAEKELSSARQVEATCRKEFDDSKRALEQLLEVDAASASRSGGRRKSLDFPAAVPTPSSDSDQEVTLG